MSDLPDLSEENGVAGVAAQKMLLLREQVANMGPCTDFAVEAERIRVWTRTRDLLITERDKTCKPLRKLAKDHSERWKPAISALDDAIAARRGAMKEFQTNKRAVVDAMVADKSIGYSELVAVSKLMTTPEGTYTRKQYSMRVVDPSKVPAQYWKIDEAALNELASDQKDAFDVPGCEIVVEEIVCIRK